MLQTTLCYIRQNDSCLMLHRVKKKNDINHDKWIGIGGKFEPGESPEDCLLRETLEETGLRLTDWRYRGIVTFLSGEDQEQMHLYTADGFEGTLKDCEEGDLQWVPLPKLYDLTLWEGDRIFLRLLQREEPFFSLKLVYDGDRLTAAVLNGTPLPATWELPPARQEKEPLLISACLLGTACRYDGESRGKVDALRLRSRYELIPVCPEQLGGLPTPRPPAERQGAWVRTKAGQDVTDAYQKGAEEALRLAKLMGCRKALLKEKSPSCGSGAIYDGAFTGNLTAGDGVTAELLKKEGILVLGESRWEDL